MFIYAHKAVIYKNRVEVLVLKERKINNLFIEFHILAVYNYKRSRQSILDINFSFAFLCGFLRAGHVLMMKQYWTFFFINDFSYFLLKILYGATCVKLNDAVDQTSWLLTTSFNRSINVSHIVKSFKQKTKDSIHDFIFILFVLCLLWFIFFFLFFRSFYCGYFIDVVNVNSAYQFILLSY